MAQGKYILYDKEGKEHCFNYYVDYREALATGRFTHKKGIPPKAEEALTTRKRKINLPAEGDMGEDINKTGYQTEAGAAIDGAGESPVGQDIEIKKRK